MEDLEHNADSCVMVKQNMLLDTDEEDLSTDEVMNQDGDSPATSPSTSDCENDEKKRSRAPASGGTAEQKKSGTTVKDKEPHMVQRRNARERRRVQLVNDGFTRLRRKIPTEPRNKKLSKVKTLQCAINYILHLQDTLDEADKLQRAAGMMDFAPVGQGGGVGMSHTQYDGMHHIQSNTHQPIQDAGLGGVPMQTNSCYSDWGYYDNMCNSYEYQGMRGNYYY